MIFSVCAVRDRAVNGYGQPIFVPHLGAAVRSFQDECNRSESALHAHPEDYDLYSIGTFDDSNAKLEACEPVMLITGKQAVIRKPE